MNQQDKDRLRELAEAAANARNEMDFSTADYALSLVSGPDVIFSLLEENEKLKADSARLEWWFSWEKKPGHLVSVYLEGMRGRYGLDQWRALIDEAMQHKGD